MDILIFIAACILGCFWYVIKNGDDYDDDHPDDE